MSEWIERDVEVINKLGLHARAATRLVQLAAGFDAQICLSQGEQQAEADSVLGILLLQGSQGKTVTVRCQGPDADDAMEAVCNLFAARFDEAE
ncbi:HPr family phosphocarrier protein [Ferrimonas marina]|uniref:Phosphocarrier protein NPr n=1 Tax=Ferrimonas marina TaxID=299255 RepID=A0A1M5Y1D7_9GAMM|nr:HPr family phosphocarrier protein [Ferrimonas marina]SHI05885.1 phosphocarrier protein NPr [Ferrimonas marina]